MKNHSLKCSRLMLLGLVISFMIVTFGAVPSEASSAKPIELTFSSYLPESSNTSVVERWWAKELEKRTNGRVKVKKWHYAGSLCGARESLGCSGRGMVDLSFVAPGYNPAQLPLSTMAEMIYTNDAPGADVMAKHELYKTYPALQREFHKSNVELMFYHMVEIGMFGIRKGITINSASDLLKYKSHSYGPTADLMKNVGMTPVAIPIPEVYESMSRKVIDGWFSVFWYMKPSRLYEVTGTMVDPGVGVFASSFVGMNKKRYDSLPDDIKQVIEDLRKDVIIFELKAHAQIDKETHALVKQHSPGMKYVSFSPEARAEWRTKGKVDDITNAYYKKREGAAPEVRDFFGKFKTLLKKYQPGVKKYYNHPFETVETKIVD
ncbi:hypothetical protein ACFL9T_20300 [Thermodesulfobacteriota bacterium]